MNSSADVTRELGMIDFHKHAAQTYAANTAGGAKCWLARAQNFFVEWVEASAADSVVHFSSAHETMVLVFGAPAQLSIGVQATDAPPRSVCIVPPGAASVHLNEGGTCAVLASQRNDLGGRTVLNGASFAELDTRITPPLPPFRRRDPSNAITVVPIDSFEAPANNPRLKMLQSDTLSINWVEYDGPRDRRALTPHSHADLEQGSLAVAGHFVHHLRQPWGKNADHWREDRHLQVGSPSLMVVPINLIHTSEGVHNERHLMVDIFSPPRRDFIAKRWVENAAGYEDPVSG